MKRFLLWDFPRASWQYDVIVVLILLFVLATPRAFFRDQPRASNVVLLPSESGTVVYWFEPDLLSNLPEGSRPARAGEILHSRTGKNLAVIRLEPIFDAEQDVKGYMAFVKP
jgi:hypothetical protein